MWKTLSSTKKPWKCNCEAIIGGDVDFCPICNKKKIMIELARKLSPLGRLMEVSPRKIKESGKKWKGQDWQEKSIEEHAKRIRKFKYD